MVVACLSDKSDVTRVKVRQLPNFSCSILQLNTYRTFTTSNWDTYMSWSKVFLSQWTITITAITAVQQLLMNFIWFSRDFVKRARRGPYPIPTNFRVAGTSDMWSFVLVDVIYNLILYCITCWKSKLFSLWNCLFFCCEMMTVIDMIFFLGC